MHEQSDIPAAFVQQFEEESARTLRNRLTWYCILALAILTFSFGGTMLDVVGPESERPPAASIWFDVATDGAYALLHVAMLGYVLIRPRTRTRLVRALSMLMVGLGTIAVLTTPLTDNSSVLSQARPLEPGFPAFAQQLVTLMSIFVLHFLASLLVALSPLEGLRILGPLVLLYWVSLLFVRGIVLPAKVLLGALAILTGTPGMLWSLWRHRSFRERFLGRVVAKRYGEMSRELVDARRVHEALFPPPVSRGPVRVSYAYEPMREIGGDFLFIRPLAFPPSEPEGPLSVILIDVTGHGVPAALAVNRIHDELARTFQTDPKIGPGPVMAALNRFAFEALSGQGMYATAACLRVAYENGTYELRWANAGHPVPLIRRGSGEIERLKATAPMLGVVPPDLFVVRDEGVGVGAGDVVVAYTDGVTETTGSDGAMVGIDGFAALVGMMGRQNGEGLAGQLLSRINAVRAGEVADDTLIVQVWVEGQGPKHP